MERQGKCTWGGTERESWSESEPKQKYSFSLEREKVFLLSFHSLLEVSLRDTHLPLESNYIFAQWCSGLHFTTWEIPRKRVNAELGKDALYVNPCILFYRILALMSLASVIDRAKDPNLKQPHE